VAWLFLPEHRARGRLPPADTSPRPRTSKPTESGKGEVTCRLPRAAIFPTHPNYHRSAPEARCRAQWKRTPALRAVLGMRRPESGHGAIGIPRTPAAAYTRRQTGGKGEGLPSESACIVWSIGSFRFRRSKSILPGVRLNISKSGPSLTVGPPHAHYTVGKRGARLNLGIPKTGISYSTKVGGCALPTAFILVLVTIGIIRLLRRG